MAKRLAKQPLEQLLRPSPRRRASDTHGIRQATDRLRVSTPSRPVPKPTSRPTHPGQSRALSRSGLNLNYRLSLRAEVAPAREAGAVA